MAKKIIAPAGNAVTIKSTTSPDLQELWSLSEFAVGKHDAMRVYLEMIGDASEWQCTDAAASMRAQERIIVLARALQNELADLTEIGGSVASGLGTRAAEERRNA